MAKSKRKSYYAIRKGWKTGIFTDWETEAKLHVHGFPGAQFKGFETRDQAELWCGIPNTGSPHRSAPSSSAGSNGTQSPRLERSPRKPTSPWSSPLKSTVPGGLTHQPDDPPSPTRSKPRQIATNQEVATKATKVVDLTEDEQGWRPTASEADMAFDMFRLIQADPWIKVEVEGRVEPTRTFYEIYFGENSCQNVVRPVVVGDDDTEEEQEARAVLVGVYEACKLIHARNDGLKYDIQTTSAFAIDCYYRRCFKWHINGWVDTDDTPVPHRDVIEPTMGLLQQLTGRIKFGKLKVVD